MKLIGMLDSPYVRRVAIALHHQAIPFEHLPLSVFRNVDEFSQINPLVKAPTLICDNGEVLRDSTLILAYIDRLCNPNGVSDSLMPQALDEYQRSLRLIGLGLNACDKTVQIVYERDLRPAEKQHQPWQDRILTQLRAAYDLIEPYAAATASDWLVAQQPSQADITVCVAWQFTQFMSADVIDKQRYPALSALSQKAEALAAFQSAPMARDWRPST
jgi:glutathione S-transferase